jgi:hypothetical protein
LELCEDNFSIGIVKRKFENTFVQNEENKLKDIFLLFCHRGPIKWTKTIIKTKLCSNKQYKWNTLNKDEEYGITLFQRLEYN